jgi:hypothetical protein
VARAAPIYEITVTITDLTNAAQSTSFVYAQSDPNNSSATDIDINSTALGTKTGTTGVTFTSLTATSTSLSTATELDASVGWIMVYSAGPKAGTISNDHYVVTLQTTHDTYTLPPAASGATLATSNSGSYTFTTAGNTQHTDSYYSPTNTANDKPPGDHAGPAFITGGIPVAGSSNASGSSPTLSTLITPYVIPYALTNVITIDITGNTPLPTTLAAASVTTITAVPEPASVVVFLTGIPLSLVIVGLLRRRRRAAA